MEDQAPLTPGAPAPDVTLAEYRTGAPTALAPLWQERGLLLVFLRHFG